MAATPEQGPGPVRYCAVYDCLHNYKTHPHLSYFMIPPEEKRCKLWLEKIRRPDIKPRNGRVSGYYRVCEVHFEPRHISANPRRRRLSRRAVPSRRLPAPAPPPPAPPAPAGALLLRGRTLGRSSLEVCEYVDAATRPHKKQRESKPSLRKAAPTPIAAPPALAELFTACDKHLNENLAVFVKKLAELQQKVDRNGDSISLNSLCLKLLVGSPTVYRLLRPALGLPSEPALRRAAGPLALHRDARLAALLALRVDRMTETEKHCTISVDFIDVRPHLYYNITTDRIIGLHQVGDARSGLAATRCAVVSARALLAGWAQAAALATLAHDDQLHEWLDSVVRTLRAIGLTVHALVSDPEAGPPRPSVTPDRPFFYVDDQKIYQLYDPPSLMKLLLCNFVSCDFHFERTVAKWNDVLEYHKMEKHKALTLTPGLTETATSPGGPRRMPPRAAARVLSRALAAALSDYAERGRLGDSSRATINLVLKISNLYDMLSSTTVKTGVEYKKGLTRDPEQIGFLTYMKSFFKVLKMKDSFGVDAANSREFVDRWQITIASVLALRQATESTRPYLLTRRLHLDDRTARIARRSARELGEKPSCQRVCAAFKKQFFADLLQSPGRERHSDIDSVLARVSSEEAGPSFEAHVEEEAAVARGEYRGLRLPPRRALPAAAALVLRAALLHHPGCAAMARYAARGPSAALLLLLARLDAALAGALRAAPGGPGLLRHLLLDLHVLDCDAPCECFPLHFVKKLFLRLRLYRILRLNRARFDNDELFAVSLYPRRRRVWLRRAAAGLVSLPRVVAPRSCASTPLSTPHPRLYIQTGHL